MSRVMTPAEEALVEQMVAGTDKWHRANLHRELLRDVILERLPREVLNEAKQAMRDLVRAQARFESAVAVLPEPLKFDSDFHINLRADAEKELSK